MVKYILFFFLFVLIINGYAEQFKGGVITAWELESYIGLGYLQEEFFPIGVIDYFPLELNVKYKVGLLHFFAAGEIGLGLKVYTESFSRFPPRLLFGYIFGFRRFLTISFWKDFSELETGILTNLNGILNLLLVKYFIKIYDDIGVFFDLNYVFQSSNKLQVDGSNDLLFALTLSFTITNECRSGFLGGGLLSFLSPQFWLDPDGYTRHLIWK